MGKREAETITLDVTSKVYRKRLAQAVTGGDLEMADSKAAFLQNLCDGLHFDPQKASEIHEGNIYCNPGLVYILAFQKNFFFFCVEVSFKFCNMYSFKLDHVTKMSCCLLVEYV